MNQPLHIFALTALMTFSSGTAVAQDIAQPLPKIQPTPLPPAVKLSPPTHADLDETRPLTAEEAVKIALARQLAIQIAHRNADAARARIDETAAGLWPTLSTDTGYSSSRANRGSFSNSKGYSSSATLSQLIFDFNVTRDAVRQSRALANAARFTYSQSMSDAVLATKQAFYTLFQDNQLVAVAEANLKSREGQFALANARFKAGLGAPQDVNLAQLNLDDAVLQITQARAAALTAQVNLANSMGVDPLTPITLAESTEAERTDELPRLIDDALTQRPEVLAAKENLRAASFAVLIAKRTTTPSISASLSWNGVGSKSISTSTRNTAGIFVTWSLFDGGLARAKSLEARAAADSSQKQLDLVRQDVTADVANVYVALKTAEQRVTITESQVANAQESARLAEGRYKAGKATFLEIIDAQAALTQAQINQVNARASLQADRAALEHAIGSRIF